MRARCARQCPKRCRCSSRPPSLDALRARLIGRGTDDQQEVERRLRVAEQELEARPEFAHVVVNDRLEDALTRLAQIIEANLDR